MENVKLIYKNFTGREGRYNKVGERSFSVLLPYDVAEAMAQDGYNVKFPVNTEDRDLLPHLQVKLNFDSQVPPMIWQITSRGRTRLTEDTVAVLDMADIINVDLVLNPYYWSIQGNEGWACYLKSIYVTIEEDALERKYAEIDDVASRLPDEEN
jgi:hypothetical protein